MTRGAEWRSTDPPARCDVVIVGAGIIGLATARELSLRHEGMRIAVLEREPRIGSHQTGASSGVIHAGIYYAPGSLKAQLCVQGARELYTYCEERGIRTERAGKVIVAVDEDELRQLDELERRGWENEVPGLERIDGDRLRELEPHAAGIAALHSAATGVVDFVEVAGRMATELVERGGSVTTACAVRALATNGEGITLHHARGRTSGRAAIVCAGAWADRLAVACGAPAEPRIVPFRGAFLRLRPERRELVRTSIYPVPNPELPFLGAHLTRGIDGEVLLGPTALMVGARDAYKLRRLRPRDIVDTVSWPGAWRLAVRHRRAALRELRHAASNRALVAELRRYVPELNHADVIPGPSGIRAQAVARDGSLVDDFIVSRTDRALHVRNAPSPAATSALPLARMIADRAESELGLA